MLFLSEDCANNIVDLIFLVDSSGSIRKANVAGQPDNYDLLLQFVEDMVDVSTVKPPLDMYLCCQLSDD